MDIVTQISVAKVDTKTFKGLSRITMQDFRKIDFVGSSAIKLNTDWYFIDNI